MALQALASSNVAELTPQRGLVSMDSLLYIGKMAWPARAAASTLSSSKGAGLINLFARSALCMAVLAGGASAKTASAAAQSGQVYLPVGPGDFGGMIMSLMQRQASLLAGADGVEVRGSAACAHHTPRPPLQPPAFAACSPALRRTPNALGCRAQTEGTPANVLATLANTLLGAQQAFVKEGTSAQSLQHTTGGKSAASYDMGAPQVDPIPEVRAPGAALGTGLAQAAALACFSVCMSFNSAWALDADSHSWHMRISLRRLRSHGHLSVTVS